MGNLNFSRKLGGVNKPVNKAEYNLGSFFLKLSQPLKFQILHCIYIVFAPKQTKNKLKYSYAGNFKPVNKAEYNLGSSYIQILYCIYIIFAKKKTETYVPKIFLFSEKNASKEFL